VKQLPDRARSRAAARFNMRKRSDRACSAPTRKPAASVLELERSGIHVARERFLQSLDDFRKIPLSTPILEFPCVSPMWPHSDWSGNAPRHRRAGRRGRSRGRRHRHAFREEPLETIDAVKRRSLPQVDLPPGGDRADLRPSALIKRAVSIWAETRRGVRRVALVCGALPFPPALGVRPIVSLPLGILAASSSCITRA